MSVEATDAASPYRKLEDTSAGCHQLASDDRTRAEQSDSAHMRRRLTRSADAWTIRAELLERLEARRASTDHGAPPAAPREDGENDNG